MTRDEALQVVDAIYAAALGEAGVGAALVLVSDAFAGKGATLEFMDRKEKRVLHFDSVRIDPHSIEVYLRDYGAETSRARYMLHAGRKIGFDQLFITESEMDRDPYYADFLRRNGLRYFISANCDTIDGDIQPVIAVQRSAEVRGVSPEHLRTMELLWPHINRALRLLWRRIRDDIDGDGLDLALARWGLTPAERRLATAMALGEPLTDYARRSRLSMNTVYTHYRRAKDKLGLHRQAAFVAGVRSIARHVPMATPEPIPSAPGPAAR